MVFTAHAFLYWFLPLFFALYYLTPKAGRSVVIALGSYVFYGWWRLDFVALMLFSTVLDYSAGQAITRARERGERGTKWLWVSCVANLSLLGYFKYADFGIASMNALLATLGVAEEPIPLLGIVLPVGISFYTFQTMSYTIDVWRGDAPPVRRFVDFACYVALWPQLVAGPIVRYGSLAHQLRERTHTFAKFGQGAMLFQMGLAKKVLIADSVGPLADAAFGAESLGLLDSWLGILAYAFQIYFDFSGYSDMAIGLGLMLGFRFPVNFDGPYRSKSITEFWRRWHISLSTWLRDYLYLPLGGNRKGPFRTYVNLAAVMLLGGLWHGAQWTFVAWGAYQGFWLIVERLFGKKSLYSWATPAGQVAITFVLALFGWVFFRATDIEQALSYIQTMLGFGPEVLNTAQAGLRPDRLQWIALLMAAIIAWGFPTSQEQSVKGRFLVLLFVQLAFVMAVLTLHNAGVVPFLYFQF